MLKLSELKDMGETFFKQNDKKNSCPINICSRVFMTTVILTRV